jgi:hypothetical protein
MKQPTKQLSGKRGAAHISLNPVVDAHAVPSAASSTVSARLVMTQAYLAAHLTRLEHVFPPPHAQSTDALEGHGTR